MNQRANSTAARSVWWLAWFAHPLSLPTMILGLLLARVVWHAFVSQLTLLEDEAHYWEWSRRLDWSYYTKGPGVAWVIRASTEVFGHNEWAVRLPAALAGAAGMLGAAMAARWTLPNNADRRGLVTASGVLFALVPGFAVASMLMTIDSPYVACWVWAGAFAARALLGGSRRAWIGFGIAIGVGFLFKYTILLLVPGVILAAWATRGHRPPLNTRSVVMGSAVACLGLAPVLLWNAQNDWSTVRHLLGHLGMAGGDMPAKPIGSSWTPRWLGEYVVLQAFVCGPVLALALIGFLRARRSQDEALQTGFKALGSMAIPLFVFYALVALRAQTEGNWAMAGTATLTPIAAWAVVDGIRRHSHLARLFWGAALVMGVGCLLAFPAIRPLSQRPVIGPIIPSSRLSGMRDHAAAVQAELEHLASQTGQEPFVMSDHYGRASELAFYLPGNPVVYCTSSFMGGRKTQHDLWAETNLRDPVTSASLLGRPALLFGMDVQRWLPLFDRVRDLGPLPGEPKPDTRSTWVGEGFRGLGDAPPSGVTTP